MVQTAPRIDPAAPPTPRRWGAWRLVGRSIRLASWPLIAALIGLNAWWAWRDRPPPRIGEIRAAIRQDRLDEAERGLLALLSRSPHDAEARIELARVKAARGDLLGCAAELNRVPPWDPNRAEALHRAAQASLQADRADLAEAAWRACFDDDPLHPTPPHLRDDAGLQLIKLLVLEGRQDEAREIVWAEYGRADWDDRPTILSMRLRLELEQIEPRDVAETLARYVAAAPDDWRARLGLARAEEDLGRPAEADRHLQVALQQFPSEPRLWGVLLEILSERGSLEGLREAVGRIPEGVEDDPRIWLARGSVREQDGDLAGAADAYAEAARRDPGEPSAHYRLGQALKRLGRDEEAEDSLQRSRSIHEARAGLRDAYGDFLVAFDLASPADDEEVPGRASAAERLAAISETLAMPRTAEALLALARRAE